MTHDEIKEKLMDYFDQECRKIEEVEIQDHLQSCEGCRLTVERWSSMRTVVNRVQPEPSEAFVKSVMARVDSIPMPGGAKAKKPAFTLPQWVFPFVGYTVALVLMVVAISERSPLISAEEVLMADMPNNSQWVIAAEVPDAAKLYGM